MGNTVEGGPKNEELNLGMWEDILVNSEYSRVRIEENFVTGVHDTWPQYALNFITPAWAEIQMGILDNVIPNEKISIWIEQLRKATEMARALDEKYPNRTDIIPEAEKEEVLSMLVFK